jgi:endonuclease YncB( thermonuclease family)
VAVLLGVGLIAATGVSLAMLPHREAATPSPPAEELNAQPAQVAVVDGGTLRLRDRVVVLQGVAPPPRGTACEPHNGSGEDCGAAATNALAALVREAPVACRITGADDLGRPYAICQASGTELNRAVIAAGWARADGDQPALKQAEEAARAEHRGVWASAHAPSW